MKLHVLIISASLMVGCANNASDTSSNANFNRTPRTSSSPNKEESPQVDKEKEARVLQKVQEFVSTNYAGWTLKGTEDLGKSPVDLHIVKGSEEKVVKVNYKEFNDLNGQPYIVVSKIAQNDLSEENYDDDKQIKSNQNNSNLNNTEQRSEKSTAPNN